VSTIGSEVIVEGWVHDRARDRDSLPVELRADGKIITAAIANTYREDLKQAGRGDGKCAFRLTAPRAMIAGEFQIAVPDTAFVLPCHYEVMPAPSLMPPTVFGPGYGGVVEGRFERYHNDLVTGWARNIGDADVPVLLDFYVDGFHYSSALTRIFRGDVAKAKGDHGHHGFEFEVPPIFNMWARHEFRVLPRGGEVRINASIQMHRLRPPAQHVLSADRSQRLHKLLLKPLVRDRRFSPSVAIIVLTYNGAALIKTLLESIESHNSHPDLEIIIVDHGSTDDTLSVISEYADRLRIHLITRDRNYSFSESNNFAARDTGAEILLFVNNDIRLTQDIVGPICKLLSDPTVGAVGINLRDSSFGTDSIGPNQHIGVHFRSATTTAFARPFETRLHHELGAVADREWRVPVITGAFFAMRRRDFEALGGFSEKYIYGFEDVDLCLRVRAALKKEVISANGLEAEHIRGFTRARPGDPSLRFRVQNQTELDRACGYWLRRQRALDLLDRNEFWSTQAPKIGFAVTKADDLTPAGDYFTALELGLSLRKLINADIVFLDRSKNEKGEEAWYDTTGLDVLVSMVDDYDISKMKGASPTLMKVAWVRNWFDRWCERPWATKYDVWWASSEKGAEHVAKQMGTHCAVVPIATNFERFAEGQYDETVACDYTFTGSYWQSPREIAYFLDPKALPFKFKLFGEGWSEHPNFGPCAQGLLPYSKLPDVYKSTKIVVDDANHVTRPWGSVNSRVFDAIAGGALPITNGVIGAKELFGDLLPTYSSAHELDDALTKFLTNEPLREGRVKVLQDVVRMHHTYDRRAEQVLGLLRKATQQLRFAIKIGAPKIDVVQEWGDWHYAMGMKRALVKLGHRARIDCLDSWYAREAAGDDVVIVLRGLSRYDPRPHQINIMWNISHPDMVPAAEYELHDHVFVASKSLAAELSKSLTVPVETLLQCTDSSTFSPQAVDPSMRHEILFVGNSRNEFRKIVKDSLAANLPISVFGTRWEGFISVAALKGQHVKNADLSAYYASAGVVLNDHWEDMKKHGLLSNRLFDAAAAGARIISDEIDGLDEIFGGLVLTYTTPDDLKAKVQGLLKETEQDRAKRLDLAKHIREHHSFDARMRRMMAVVGALERARLFLN
jgi:GT2 family glycosyltransferase/spore maturation protein CgeB